MAELQMLQGVGWGNLEFSKGDNYYLAKIFQKVAVWSGLWAGGIKTLYFFKDTANRSVTVNIER